MKKNRIACSLIVSFIFFTQTIYAQADSSTVTVHKDPRIELLVTRQMQANELASRNARRVGKGYRILIISTSNRDEAIAAKTKLYTYFPELKAYLWHQSPFYKVKAGNFVDRNDAEDYINRMSSIFPKGIFIMNDAIELKLDKVFEDD